MEALKGGGTIGVFPASVPQKRCWFMEQIHPGGKGLNLAVRWELRGPAAGDDVERAFQKIVDRHEILRTRFIERGGEPFQEVMEHADFKLDRFDIRNVPERDHEARVQAIAAEHAGERFDLSAPCLLRAALVQIEPERAALLISVHNSVFDGYSIGILGHELGTILAAIEAGREPGLPELTLQYGDYAMWLAEVEASGAMDAEAEYWRGTLGGMRYFELPPDRPRTAAEPQSRTFAWDLPEDFEPRMLEAAKAWDTSVFVLGAAAVSVALERLSGRRDVSFAAQVAGRSEVDLEPMIGIFTNPVVLRFDVDASGTLGSHVRAAREVVNGALAHQTLPFDRVVQKLNPPRDPLRIPLVSVMFNLQQVFLKERSYGSVELRSVPSHSPGTLYDLNINIIGRSSGWRLVTDYNARLFDEATVRAFSDLAAEVLEAVMEQPETPVTGFAGAGRAGPAEDPPSQDNLALNAAARPPGDRARSGIKERLAGIWSELLEIPVAQTDANFFDIGGHSALALRMLFVVGNKFAFRPSIHAFLSNPTLDGLAGILHDYEMALREAGTAAGPKGAEIWELAELRPGSPASPVLLTVNQPFMYQALARGMALDCAVANLGIASPEQLEALEQAGFDAALEQSLTLTTSRYSGRPLILCGLCVDGRAALRLAQLLRGAGEHVACLAMIDTWAPGAVRQFPGFALWRNRWRIRLRRLRYYLGLRLGGRISTLDVLRQNDAAKRWLARLGMAEADSGPGELVDRIVDRLVVQTRDYDFTSYDGEAVLFITRAQALMPEDGILGWASILPPDTAVYPVDGWHGDALIRSGFERISTVLEAKARRLAAGTGQDGSTRDG